jgi:hypothetical protein
MVCTVRGWCLLDMDDGPAAEAEARRTLLLVDGQDLRDAARVGPRVLLAEALRSRGDLDGAIGLLAEVAGTTCQESLIFPRRQAVAAYASALLAAGRVAEALDAARRGLEVPAEDVRSGVHGHLVHAQALAANGHLPQARDAARKARDLAYATERVSERAPADELLAELSRH